MKYLREEIKAGIIIVTALVILSGSIILIGGSSLYEKFDVYYVYFMNSAGLETGAQVRLGGVRVGRILDISPPQKPGEPVTVKVGIKKGTILYKGTKALITQIGFVGDIYLLLTVDQTTNEKMKIGNVIPSEEKAQFDILMSRMNALSQSVDTLVNDIDKLFSKKNLEGIENLIGNTNNAIVSGSTKLEQVAITLKVTTEKLESVLTEIESLVRGNKDDVTQIIKRAKDDIEKAGDMIKSFESTAKAVEKTSKSVDSVVHLQSRNLENLISNMTKTTNELRELLQEIKHKPWRIIYKEKGRE
jgi:phospholipid/cholesterol/gamma-HCH transport system substrate-binding protein